MERLPLRIIRASILALACACHQAPSTAPLPVAASSPNLQVAGADTVHPVRPDVTTTAPGGVVVTPAEVTRAAVKVFGDSLATALPPLDSAPAIPASEPAAAGPSWDIDVRSFETRDRVAHYVALFSGNLRDHFVARLERGTRYEAMIRRKLRAAKLPEDMMYLALIESGYDPNAYSSAAAVGMWQLMTSTAQGTGLRVDWWVDERRDPVRSTDSAIRFLRWLNEQFGSLYLAAAAYDGGPGRIARGLARYAEDLEGQTGDARFFALAEKDYLRAETKNYVPQLIAAALVAKQPEKYGLHVTPQPPFAYDSVRVPPSTPLSAVAAAAGASVREIGELNPQVLRGVTPPRIPFLIRVPVGEAASFDSAFAALPREERTAYRRVTSRKGQTVDAVARREGMGKRQLLWYNPKLEVARKTGRIAPGQTILVPSPAVVAAAREVPDPSIERYGTSRRVHVVRRGETLGGIARKYHTSTAAIMRLNGMRRSMIFPGQTIAVKGGGRVAKGRVHGGRRRKPSARR